LDTIGKNHLNTSEAIAIHPKNPDTVYLGTNGIIRRSTDGGNTWTSVFALNGLWVYDLDIPESSAHIILAATNKGLYRSANSGQSWTQVFAEASSELKVLNVKNNIVISTRYNSLTKQYYPVKSINFGMTFSDKKSGWYTSGDGVFGWQLLPPIPKRIYAIALTSDKGPYLMRSIDEGETWSTMAKGKVQATIHPTFHWTIGKDIMICR
jgi:hypothetical protein